LRHANRQHPLVMCSDLIAKSQGEDEDKARRPVSNLTI
jgi:hypothetical protein